jgi:hypothetical protein
MATVYKIHPAIGIARLGNHPDAFFIGPERPGSLGVELSATGAEVPITRYKKEGRIKRQAARFRIFKFNQTDDGALELIGEVTADDATIKWKVDLSNRKGALDHNPAPGHPALPRNKSVADRDTLIIRNPQPVTISGPDQAPREFNGQFLGKPVYLGELRTDSKGRLLVLGGRGGSESVPAGEPLPSFANNDKWHDDVSDGPVTAVITLPGQEPIAAHHPSWITVGPPDFAPGIGAIVTLYDVAFQAAIEKGTVQRASRPSFRRDLKPVIERAGLMRWVNDFEKWALVATANMTALADPGPSSSALRQKIAMRLKSPGFQSFNMPEFLKKYLDQWAAGDFIGDLDAEQPPLSFPDELDRAALDSCVGNNFYPGIEASINLQDKDIYARPFRLDHTNLGKVYPGCLTELMAVPWQADFIDCDDGVWWPTQRPDIAMIDAESIPDSVAGWADPMEVTNHALMVEHAFKLGFVVETTNSAGQPVYIEQDRDTEFPRSQVLAGPPPSNTSEPVKG